MNEERRRSPRQSLPMPVQLLSPGDGRTRLLVEATTTNISAGGLYVQCAPSETPVLGAPVRVRVFVPEARIDRYSYIKFDLGGTGTVVRLDRRGTSEFPLVGIAIAFDRHLEFENFMVL